MEKVLRKVDSRQYISELLAIVEEGKDVALTITGSSMEPFLIHERDQVILSKIQKPLKKGDIAMFKRDNGQFVVHRIYKIKKQGYYFVGDGQDCIEGPIKKESVLAIVVAVKRKNQWIKEEDLIWWFFQGIWLYLIPLRKWIKRVYGCIK